jgi:hypothetical protein
VWQRTAGAVVLGLLFGATATLLNVPAGDLVLDASPRRVASLVVNSGAAWAGAAVLGGWLGGSVLRGLVAGPVVLVAAVVTYYLLGAAVGSENADGSPESIVLYGSVSVVTGTVLGVVGGLIRRRGVLGLVAALVVPMGIFAEQLWRSSIVGLPPDPAHPAAAVILLGSALGGAAAAVARFLRQQRSPPVSVVSADEG